MAELLASFPQSTTPRVGNLTAIGQYKTLLTNMGLGAQALLLIQADDAAGTDALLQRVEQICVTHGAEDIARSTDPVEADMLLQARRLALPALERLGDWLLDDVAVPRSRIVDLIAAVQEISAQLDLRIGVFGHAGDGNLHPTVIFDDADPASRAAAHHAFNRITQKALELGGTITGEHGIGLLKKQWLTTELNDVAAEVQATIKHALDPTRILNPSKVIDAIDLNRPGFDAASFLAKDADHGEEVSQRAAGARDPDGG